MQLSETLGDFRPRTQGPGAAAPLAGVWSVALHAAVIAWFLATGGGGGSDPLPLPGLAPEEQPLYVTIVPDPAARDLPAADPIAPAMPPETMEAVDAAPLADILPAVEPVEAAPDETPETAPAPKVEAATAEVIEALEISEIPQPVAKMPPQPRLAAVQPPARPKRPAPSKPASVEPAAPALTSTTAPSLAAPPEPMPHAASLPGGKAGPVGPAETGLLERAATFPDYLANPAPAYPRSELRRGREGFVLLRVRVTPTGRAADVSVSRSSGIAAFDQAAIRAVRAWRFVPATRGGRAVAGTVEVPIRFTLTRS